METTKIKATNIDLTTAIVSYVESKLSKEILGKFSGHGKIFDVNVEIGKTTKHHVNGEIFRAEINVSVKGKVLRAVSDKEDLYSAIDDVHDEIVEVLRDSKERKDALWRRGARKIKEMLRLEK